MTEINKFAQMIKECQKIVFFGGAGVSTESGVKDYRSEDGIYNTVKEYDVPPEKILSRSFFEEHPEIFYDFFRKYFIVEGVEPNSAHKALGKLETMNKNVTVITQNVDGLHQAAGSTKVLELHGTTKEFYCKVCKEDGDREELTVIKSGAVPKCKKCGGVMKPKVVLYEERLNDDTVDAAIESISKADMLIVGGTSLAVYPAASFLDFFKGKYIVIINKGETHLDSRADIVFNESIGEVFNVVMEALKEKL